MAAEKFSIARTIDGLRPAKKPDPPVYFMSAAGVISMKHRDMALLAIGAVIAARAGRPVYERWPASPPWRLPID